jgi:hypothetical protein
MCDVAVAPGDNFLGLRSSWDRVADLVATGETPAQARRRADAAAELIEIDVRPAAARIA